MARRRQFPATGLDRNSRPWTRLVEDFIRNQDARNEREDSAGVNASKVRNGAFKRQAATIRSLPFNVTGYDSQTGFALSAGWNEVARVVIDHPAGWQNVSFAANGGAAALDDLSGGLTLCEGRITIGGTSSITFAPAKDAGASKVNNILSPQFGRKDLDASTATSTVCTLELRPVNPLAFPAAVSNYSSLSVIALFTNTVFVDEN